MFLCFCIKIGNKMIKCMLITDFQQICFSDRSQNVKLIKLQSSNKHDDSFARVWVISQILWLVLFGRKEEVCCYPHSIYFFFSPTLLVGFFWWCFLVKNISKKKNPKRKSCPAGYFSTKKWSRESNSSVLFWLSLTYNEMNHRYCWECLAYIFQRPWCWVPVLCKLQSSMFPSWDFRV